MSRRCGRARQLGLVLHREEEFAFRPYIATVVGNSRGASYPGEDVFMDSKNGELVLAGHGCSLGCYRDKIRVLRSLSIFQ